MNSLKEWRERHLLLADAIVAVFTVSVLIALMIWQWSPETALSLLDGSRAAAYGTLASISGSLLGFILTAVSIISVFGHSPKFDILRRTGQYEQLFHIFFQATYLLAFNTLWSLLALILDTEQSRHGVVTLISVLIVALIIARIYRCIWILRQVVYLGSKTIDETQPKQ